MLVLTCVYLGYAPAKDLLPGKNSGDTRWCARCRARTTKPEVEKSFRAEMPAYCQGRDLLSGNTVMFRYWEGPNCEWSVQMQWIPWFLPQSDEDSVLQCPHFCGDAVCQGARALEALHSLNSTVQPHLGPPPTPPAHGPRAPPQLWAFTPGRCCGSHWFPISATAASVLMNPIYPGPDVDRLPGSDILCHHGPACWSGLLIEPGHDLQSCPAHLAWVL